MENSTPKKREHFADWWLAKNRIEIERASGRDQNDGEPKMYIFTQSAFRLLSRTIKYEKMLKWERKVRRKKTRRKYGYCRSDERDREKERNSKRFARDKNYRKLSNVLGLAAICMPFVLTCMRYASVVRCGDATWCLPYMQLQVATHAHNVHGTSYTRCHIYEGVTCHVISFARRRCREIIIEKKHGAVSHVNRFWHMHPTPPILAGFFRSEFSNICEAKNCKFIQKI